METATLSTAIAKATGIRFGGSRVVSEVDSGDCVAAATAEVEIRRGPFPFGFSAGKRRLLLLGGVRQPVRELSLSFSLHLSLSLSI